MAGHHPDISADVGGKHNADALHACSRDFRSEYLFAMNWDGPISGLSIAMRWNLSRSHHGFICGPLYYAHLAAQD